MRQLFSSIPGQVLDFMVVLIGLVIVFKKQINTLLTNIFKQINSKSKEVYLSGQNGTLKQKRKFAGRSQFS